MVTVADASYVREYNFSGFQASNPGTPVPAGSLDNEFINIERAISGLGQLYSATPDFATAAETAAAAAAASAAAAAQSAVNAAIAAAYTPAEIKTAYESNADTNAFTDDEKTKLSGIEASADVTDATNVAAAGAVMDSDFGSNGLMKRTGAGSYDVAVDGVDYMGPGSGVMTEANRTAIKGAGLSAGAVVYNREAGYEGPYELKSGNYTGLADEYAILTDDAVAIGTGAWVKKYYRPPRPQDFGAAVASLGTPDGIQRAIDYAAANIGEVLFDAQYVINGPVDLADNLKYIGVPGNMFDGRQASVGAFNSAYSYTDGMLMAGGSAGSSIALDADIVPIKASQVNGNMTQSAGVATINVYGFHGLVVDDLVNIVFAAGFSSMPTGALDYLTQIVSDEQMARDLPVPVTEATDDDTFKIAVDSGATSPISGSSVFVWKNSNVIKSVSAHGLSVGDWVELNTNVDVPVLSGSQTIKYAEKFRVVRVPDTTTAVLHGDVKYEYLTANSASMRKLTMLERIEASGLYIKGHGSSGLAADDGDNGLVLDLVERAILTGIRIDDCESFGLCVQRYGDVSINEFRSYADFSDDAGRESGVTKTPYGICYGGHGNSLSINSPLIIGNWRHDIAEATTGANPGVSDQVDIRDAYLIGAVSNAIACHYPNDGFNVWGGRIRSNEFSVDVRAGNVRLDGVQCLGGWGLLYASGHPNTIQVDNCRAVNCSRDAINIIPNDSASVRDGTVRITGFEAKDCRTGITIDADGSGRMEVVIDGFDIDGTEFAAIDVTYDSTEKGSLTVKNGKARNITRYATTAKVVDLTNADDYEFANWSGSAHADASGYVPYALTNCTGGVVRNVKDATPETIYISGGALTLTRDDDHQIVVRGEGDAVDNLDQIIGLNTGQRITLVRYSNNITVRDEGTSTVPAASGGIQTASGTSIVLNSAYRTVTIMGVGTAAYPVVVEDATGV